MTKPLIFTMLWVDKYRPRALENLDYHPELTERLKNLAESGDLPHLLFYGPSGAGKKTRVNAMLRALYGPGVERMKTEHKVYKVSSSKKIDIFLLNSIYHMELNVADAAQYDRVILPDLLKETSQTAQLDAAQQKSFKVVVLNDADRMTREAQQTLRRTMEKYADNCRLILCCENLSKLIEPLRSRCLAIRVAAPAVPEVCEVLQNVALKEKIELPDAFAKKIAEASERNLRRAILMLEASRVEKYPFSADQAVSVPDWQRFIDEMAKSILEQQNSARLLEIRGKTYELLQNCIPATVIMKTLLLSLCKLAPDDMLKQSFTEATATFEHRLQLGSQEIFHIEAMVAKIMAIYKRWHTEMLNSM